jgi:hypothetical protein
LCRQPLLVCFERLDTLLRVLEIVAILVSWRGWQGRLRPPLVLGVAAIVQIGLRLELCVGRPAGRTAIDQDDVECTRLESARGIGKLKMQRQHQAVQQQGNAERQPQTVRSQPSLGQSA